MPTALIPILALWYLKAPLHEKYKYKNKEKYKDNFFGP